MRTNIEILENLSVNHKKLKEEKPYLLFKILKAMDVARTEQLTIPVVAKSVCTCSELPNGEIAISSKALQKPYGDLGQTHC